MTSKLWRECWNYPYLLPHTTELRMRIILKHAVTTGKSVRVRVLTRKIPPGKDIMCLARGV
jgi:hypothetical protein